MPLPDVEDFYPLSPMQQGLLFHSLYDPTSRMYFNQTLVSLGGALDEQAFRGAWQTAVDHHQVLRTFFVWEDLEKPVQVVQRSATMPFEVLDWRNVSVGERAGRLDALRRSDLERGFDLSQAPLMRVVLVRTEDDAYTLLWSFHHILMDGWSMFQVLGQVFGAYDALVAGGAPSLPASRPFRDHIAWLAQRSLPKAEAFWRRTLAGFTAPTPLPWDATTEAASGEEFAVLERSLTAATTRGLIELARTHRLTLNTILQGAWALLLGRSAGESDVVFGAVVSGRPPELEGVETMVGLFINSLPVRVFMPGNVRLVPWLQRIQTSQAEQREYEYSPLVEVQGWSEAPGGSALFESLFLFENYKKDVPIEAMCRSLKIGDIRWYERHNFAVAAVAVPGSELALRIIYMTDRFSAAAVERMLGHWRTLLEGMVAAPDSRLEDLPILTGVEREQLVIGWNDTRTDYPRDSTIHALFEDQAAERPDAVALSFEGQTLSYGALNRRANQLAHHLAGLGVGPEVPVGLCVERSIEMVVAILGILKAGGAYVSLDPSYPSERLALMLDETHPPVLLTQESLAGSLPEFDGDLLRLDADWQRVAGESEDNPAAGAGPENLAYVIYTSGSTGRPKGTCVPHRAVVRLVKETDFADFSEDQVFLQFATISFDASTLELWGPLLNGCRLVVFPPGKPSHEELGAVIAREGVTTAWLTAGLFHQMMEAHPQGLQGLTQLLVGGDVLSVPHVKQAIEQLEGCTVINGYGPTENTTFTCCHPMTRADQLGRSVAIGRPIANSTVYLLDEQMRLVPVGVTGTLYTGGDGVSRGYLHHPALTAERFVPDPFSDMPGARLYDTGDQARWLQDGTIEFLGRTDHQVKVRGFRVELGEIEAALAAHPELRDAVVLAREDEPGDKKLVAYVTCEPSSAPASMSLRAFLKDRLPDYMLPAAFVTLENFPLTANGKVDRRSLPAPEGVRPELDTAYAAPEAGSERTITGIWQETLKLEQVGVHDNFFDLGGHSLHLIQVHGKLKVALGREISMVDMFRFPTVSALAAHLGRETDGDATEPEDPTGRAQAGKSRLQKLRQRRRRDG